MDPPFTLPFDDFWRWVVTHPNCVVRAGTPETVLYDDDDFHWHFASYEDGALGVQVLRGKRFVGEIFVEPEQVAYVQGLAGEVEGEHVFELISETETDRSAVYYFVMAHGFEDDRELPLGRVH